MNNSTLIGLLLAGTLLVGGFAIWWPNRRRLFQIKLWTIARFFLLLTLDFAALLLLANALGGAGSWPGWLALLLTLAGFSLVVASIGGLFGYWLMHTDINDIPGEKHQPSNDDRSFPDY